MTGIALMSTPIYAQADANQQPDIENNRQQANRFDFRLRFGMGGFRDHRSPVHSLGGDQMALDIKPVNLPIMLSISGEYYTNSPEPTHSYEISDMVAINLLYRLDSASHDRLDYFFGGGTGWLKVPSDINNPEARIKDNLINLEAGVHYRYFERAGFYAAVKYLRAEKTAYNMKLINFSERIMLVGITYNFSF